MGIPKDVEAGQQEQDGDQVDHPEPAQSPVKGPATGIVQMVIEPAGEAALFSGEHARPPADKPLALGGQTQTMSAFQ
ncbi:hypothetical protein D3C80_1577150 [compost metagenome]